MSNQSTGSPPSPRGCARWLPIVGFGCLPGLAIGTAMGLVLGILVWELVRDDIANGPWGDIEIPEGRLTWDQIQTTTDAFARDYLSDKGSVGLVVAVLRDEDTAVWGYGRKHVDRPEPPDGATLFELASVGKTFTGLLLAEMQGRNELRWTDRLQDHLPAGVTVPSFDGRAITLLDLATQSSGLPSLPPDFPFSDPLNPYRDYTPEQMFAAIRSMTLPRKPGTEYEYSNLGFGLLGAALAHRAGTDYEALVIERIGTPLGMHRTRMTLDDSLRANLATPHDVGKPVPIWEDTTMPGAGSFLSTPDDMLRYLRLYVGPTTGLPESLVTAAAEAVRKRRRADVSHRSLGLAWHIDSENANDIAWHNGGAGGSSSYMAFTTSPACGVIVLSNSTNSVDELGHAVLSLLLQADP